MSTIDVRAAVARRMPELWQLVERWVGMSSFTADHADCDAMADALAEAFALPGLSMQRTHGDGAGDHVAFVSDAWGRAPGVLLVGHHDTVFPRGSAGAFRRDDRMLYGPGVLDMKGGLAIVRTALAALADVGALAGLPVALISVSDEETGSVDGARAITGLVRGGGAGVACGLVFEAGRLTDAIVTRRKGTGKLTVSVRGVAAHAGNDLAAGVNAIWALSRFVDGAQRLTAADGAVTVNVGTFHGGTSANTVPADARCELDLRLVRAADGDALLAALDRLARDLAAETGAVFTLSGGIRRPPLEALPGTAPILARYAAAARAEGLGASEAPLMGGGSDANTLAALGVPALDGLGPRGAKFHTPDEYAEAATFEPRVHALVRFLLDGESSLAPVSG